MQRQSSPGDARKRFQMLREQTDALLDLSRESVAESKAQLDPSTESRVPVAPDPSFSWLPIEAFKRLTPAQKERYLQQLAEHLAMKQRR